MKKWIIVSALMLLVSAAVSASEFKEGVHYDTVDAPASETPEVREYFSFYCPHCYNFERLMGAIKPNLADGVFVRHHVDNLGLATATDQQRLSKALITLQQMPSDAHEKGVAMLFDVIHRQRLKDTLKTEQALLEMIVATGIDRTELERVWSSEATEARLDKNSALQELMFERDILQGVPSVIVNGKYRINHQGLDRENVIEQYTALLNHLLEK